MWKWLVTENSYNKDLLNHPYSSRQMKGWSVKQEFFVSRKLCLFSKTFMEKEEAIMSCLFYLLPCLKMEGH